MQAKLQRHSMERAKAETALVQMRSCRDFVSKELETRSDYQIQAAKVELIKRIDGTHSVVRVSRLQPTQPDTVFTADRNVMSACGHIGRISDNAMSKKGDGQLKMDVEPSLKYEQPPQLASMFPFKVRSSSKYNF